MQSKVSAEKNSISMNLGLIMERDEKRFEYHFYCSSEENNVEENKVKKEERGKNDLSHLAGRW